MSSANYKELNRERSMQKLHMQLLLVFVDFILIYIYIYIDKTIVVAKTINSASSTWIFLCRLFLPVVTPKVITVKLAK